MQEDKAERFDIGDRVRIVSVDDPAISYIIGTEGIVAQIFMDHYRVTVPGDYWYLSDRELELVQGTMEDHCDAHYRFHYKGIKLDPYRIFTVYGITCPAMQHAIKKLLCAGNRGAKSLEQDIDEAIVSLQRKKEMMREDSIE